MLVTLAVRGIPCYQAGVSSTKAAYEDEQSAERAYAVALAKSYFERLDLDGETIYVTGHQHPDADTVCSAIGYAGCYGSWGMTLVPSRSARSTTSAPSSSMPPASRCPGPRGRLRPQCGPR